MKHIVLPAKAGHRAHVIHAVVQRVEWVAHVAYLYMTAVGNHDYQIAVAAMLGTTVVGAALHMIISMSEEI